jgi:hypothetical protein
MCILFKTQSKVFLAGAGEDKYYYKYGYNNLFRYWFYSDLEVVPSYKGLRKLWFNLVHNFIEKRIVSFIPAGCEYKIAWEKYCTNVKIENFVPMAIHQESTFIIEKQSKKLVFFHGINREDVKGSKFIVKALKKLERNFPNEVEVIVDGGLPLAEYLKILNKTDVVLDQCKSYGYGMNALYAMSLGKVVMSGAEPECKANMETSLVPVINIKPDSEQIYLELEALVLNRDNIEKLKVDSHEYVSTFHDPIYVANKYLEIFTLVK